MFSPVRAWTYSQRPREGIRHGCPVQPLKSQPATLIILSVENTLTVSAAACGRFDVATDVVIFAIRDDALQVLLRRRASQSLDATYWALPGGYVDAARDLDECAARTLADQTGIRDVYLEQLYTFGQPERHPASRVISVAYYALVSGERLTGADSEERGTWWPVDRLPEMYLDHERIVLAARARLEAKLEYSTIAFQLMPERFTLSELQHVYETIHGRPIDKRNFRKRVLAMNCVEATDAKRCNGSHRPARLYRYTAGDAIQYLK